MYYNSVLKWTDTNELLNNLEYLTHNLEYLSHDILNSEIGFFSANHIAQVMMSKRLIP